MFWRELILDLAAVGIGGLVILVEIAVIELIAAKFKERELR